MSVSRLVLALAGVVAFGAPAGGQGLPIPGFGNTGGALPVAIEAENGVEWRQNEQVYVARGNATAKRGDTVIRADTLTAHYRRTGENRQEIWKIVAEGATKITTPKETITSDSAQYIVESAVFTLLGRPVTLDNGKSVLTAGRVDYNSRTKVANVTGNATVVEDKRRVRADRFVAFFKDDAGKNNLARVEAQGNVIITTPLEVARGDRGDYDAEARIATLSGNVKLTRGDNQLNGERAEVNMKTGVSRLLAASGGGSQPDKPRVRVLIVPGEGDDKIGPDLPGADSKNGAKAAPKKP